MSALVGAREEIEAMVRARIDEAVRRLDLVRREDIEALSEMAANARAGQEAAEAQLADIRARLAALESRPQPVEPAPPPANFEGGQSGGFEGGGGPN